MEDGNLEFLIIKGDHLQYLDEIYTLCGYKEQHENHHVANQRSLLEMEYDRDLPVYFACVVNEWTVIDPLDDSISRSEEKCLILSRRFNTQVFTCYYSKYRFNFAYYNKVKLRAYSNVDGEIKEDLGDPLSIEEGIDLAFIFHDKALLLLRAS